MKGLFAAAICCVLLAGCPVKRSDDGGADHPVTPEAQNAELAVRVFAALKADKMDELQDFEKESVVQDAAAASSREAFERAFDRLDQDMQKIDPWNPAEGERVWREHTKGFRKAAAR